MPLVLGVAFGPRSTRVEVRDADHGTLVATGEARHAEFSQDVDADDPTAWWRSVVAAVARAGEREIAGIAISGGHPGLVLLDGAGAVLRPVPTWAEIDADRDAARLRKGLGAEWWARTAGMLPSAATAVTRLAWLRRTDPSAFERIGAVLLPHDWLTYRMSGRMVTDRGSASLTGAWSPRTEGWIPQVLEHVAPPGRAAEWTRRLPAVVGPNDEADWLTAPVYELLGLRGRPLVGPGTGEPMAVALALGVQPGRIGISIGASTSVMSGTGHPVEDATGAVRSRADATGQHLALSTNPGGAPFVEGISRLLGRDLETLGALAAQDDGDAEGIVVIPGVSGRGGAVITGVGHRARPEALARATFDGLACAALDAVDLLADAGVGDDPDEPIRLAGPEPWLRAQAGSLASLSGRPVLVAPPVSLAAAGACTQAAAMLFETGPEAISEAWDLAGSAMVDPDDDGDRVERRLAHAEERARQRRALLDRAREV